MTGKACGQWPRLLLKTAGLNRLSILGSGAGVDKARCAILALAGLALESDAGEADMLWGEQ